MIRAILLLLVITLFLRGEIKHIVRYPAPSPDGTEIVFNSGTDLWIGDIDGKRFTPLSISNYQDKYPKWSPDGNSILFSSSRNYGWDIYKIDLESQNIDQLTYHSAFDKIDNIDKERGAIFTSSRIREYHKMKFTYSINLNGKGTPQPIINEYCDGGRFSSDNNLFIFTRGAQDWYRKHYRGSAQTDIWCYSFSEDSYTKLTDHDGYDTDPLLNHKSDYIYYRSDMGKDSTFNLWRMELNGENKTQLTFFNDDGIRNPEISYYSNIITFEQGYNIHKYNIDNKELTTLNISLPKLKQGRSNKIEHSKSIKEISISNNLVAYVSQNNIYLTKIMDGFKKGFTREITNDQFRNEDPILSRDGTKIIYVSDKGGSKDIYLAESEEDSTSLVKVYRFKTTQLTDSDESERLPQLSPDEDKISYISGSGNLNIMDLDGDNRKLIKRGFITPYHQWSPDGRWIAYQHNDGNHNSDIYLYSIEDDRSYNISKHPQDDYNISWSKDSKKFYFNSYRFSNSIDIWSFTLSSRDLDGDRVITDLLDGREDDNEKKFNPENLKDRVKRVTNSSSVESKILTLENGDHLLYLRVDERSWSLHKVKESGGKESLVKRFGNYPSYIQLSDDEKYLYWVKGNMIKRCKVDGSGEKSINLKTKRVVNRDQLREQLFNESWKIIDDRFYDPNFHGIDWDEIYEKYLPLAKTASCYDEIRNIVLTMIGELNSSHLGFSRSSDYSQESGFFGVEFDLSYSGDGFKVKRVIEGSPADMDQSRLYVGDIIKEIDGEVLDSSENIYKYLFDKAYKYQTLAVEDSDNNERIVIIKPLPFYKIWTLIYNEWVERNRAKVKNLSKNRLGYLHIRSMDNRSLEQFEADLYDATYEKDGLVIDVRMNGGGRIADYLLAILDRKPHAYTKSRGGELGYPEDRVPQIFYEKPIVVLCDQWSFSNAEIFSHAISVLKRGKLVGVETAGGVISTSSTKLLDGTSFRVPFRGWYRADNGVNQENNGAKPDIVIKNLPGDLSKGIDRQLSKSVEVLLSEIK